MQTNLFGFTLILFVDHKTLKIMKPLFYRLLGMAIMLASTLTTICLLMIII